MDGKTVTFLKQQRHVDVIVPLQATLWSSTEAVPRAELHEAWQPPPARAHQHIAFVQGVAHLWQECAVPRHAGVMRYGNGKKNALDPSVLVTTDQHLNGPWMVRPYGERPEIEQE